ncbi:MAG: hypothetical protein NXI13_08130 [Proteobacteria bacterium]|nr:hypothetical protein [Pseudomonadota bacterium]
MCGLCGLMGIEHWTETSANSEAFISDTNRSIRNERAHRVELINRALGPLKMRVRDFQASSYTLTSATGRTEIVHDIQSLWVAVENISACPVDPLDPDYLDHLFGESP